MIKRIIKYIIAFSVMLVAIIGTWGLLYGFEVSLEAISNSTFLISITVFVIALIMHTGATRATLGLSYTARSMVTPTKMKEKYAHFKEYYDEKAPKHVKRMDYLLIICGIFIAIAFILSMIYIGQTPNV
jgi:hypothetical protein